MRPAGALGVVAIFFALALLQPWSLLTARESEVASLDTRSRDGAVLRASVSAELEEARRCSGVVRRADWRAHRVCQRITERRSGVETRLGKVRGSDRR